MTTLGKYLAEVKSRAEQILAAASIPQRAGFYCKAPMGRAVSFFKAEDFAHPVDKLDAEFWAQQRVHFEHMASIANAKRDEVREILEDELIKVRAEIERLRAELSDLHQLYYVVVGQRNARHSEYGRLCEVLTEVQQAIGTGNFVRAHDIVSALMLAEGK